MVVIMPPCAGPPIESGICTWYIDKKKDFDSPDKTQIKMLFLTFIFYRIILLQGSRFLYIHAPMFPVEDNDHYHPYPHQNGREVVKKSQCHCAWLNIHPSDCLVPSVLCLSWCTFGRKEMMMALNLLLLMMAVTI